LECSTRKLSDYANGLVGRAGWEVRDQQGSRGQARNHFTYSMPGTGRLRINAYVQRVIDDQHLVRACDRHRA